MGPLVENDALPRDIRTAALVNLHDKTLEIMS